jgi:hypothetical protein
MSTTQRLSRPVDLGEWRAHLFGRLRREIALTADPGLAELYQELRAYPCDQPEPDVEVPGPGDVLVRCGCATATGSCRS